MSEADAPYYEDADKIEGTEEIRTPTGSIGDFMKSQPKSEPATSTRSRGNSSDSSAEASAA